MSILRRAHLRGPRYADALARHGALLEIVGLALLLAAALWLRLHQLTTVPTGIHGDEAESGLEALRILRDGLIGPYSPTALGRPAGFFYLLAPSVALLGNTILALRIVPAILGTLTVLGVFLLLRRHAGRAESFLGAIFLAGMLWHLHLSRVSFHGITWPLASVFTALALLEAIRRQSKGWWALAGALAGLGVYTYQAHPLFLGGMTLFIAVLFALARGSKPGLPEEQAGAPRFSHLLLMLAGFATTSLPMTLHALTPNAFSSVDQVSVFARKEWQELRGPVDQATFLIGRYFQFWPRVCCTPRVDHIDGSGEEPLASLGLLVLGAAGAVLGGFWQRRPAALFAICCVLILPVAAAVTFDGVARRPFAVTPFLASLAAIGSIQLIRLAAKRGMTWAALSVAGVTAITVTMLVQDYQRYFVQFAASASQRWVFTNELTDASLFMKDLTREHYVYLYSDRWGEKYGTRVFLAPETRIEDRSSEFHRPAPEALSGFAVDLDKGKPVFILIGKYKAQLEELQRRYPGGTITRGGTGGEPTFVAYIAPMEAF